MEVKLTKAAVAMAYRMFWHPHTMTEDKPYAAKDAIGAADVLAIQRWLASKVFEPMGIENGAEQYRFVERTKKIKENYLKRFKEIVTHYEKSGYLISNIEGYLDLKNGLDGKTTTIEEVEGD